MSSLLKAVSIYKKEYYKNNMSTSSPYVLSVNVSIKIYPRWLSGWGIIGVILSLIVTVIGAFNLNFISGVVNTIFNAPIAIQEMVLALWLIVKGFNQPLESTQ